MARAKTIEEAADPVGEALGLVRALEAKRQDLISQREALGGEREKLAYTALGQGNVRAQNRVAQINGELALFAEQMATLDAAITEGGRRLAAARNAAALDVERQRAEEVLAHLVEVVRHAAALDQIAAQLVERSRALQSTAQAIRGLGCESPNLQMVRVASQRALSTALIGGLLEFERLPPSERHSFLELATGWATSIRAWAAERGAGDTGDDAERAVIR